MKEGLVRRIGLRSFEQEKNYTGMIKNINENFFKTWTPAMTWVLGVIASDGCIYIDKKHYRNQLIISMKDLDILEKIKFALNSDHKILTVEYFKWNRRFSIYRLVIARKEIINDLLKLGITPRKSKTLKLPKVPARFLNHFIRGYLDGDGSIIKRAETNRPSFRYMIFSGSRYFTNQLMLELRKRGFRSSFRIKDSGADQIIISNKVGEWLYKNKNIWFGARKFNIVNKYL